MGKQNVTKKNSAGSVLLLVLLSWHVASPFHRRTSNEEPTPYDILHTKPTHLTTRQTMEHVTIPKASTVTSFLTMVEKLPHF